MSSPVFDAKNVRITYLDNDGQRREIKPLRQIWWDTDGRKGTRRLMQSWQQWTIRGFTIRVGGARLSRHRKKLVARMATAYWQPLVDSWASDEAYFLDLMAERIYGMFRLPPEDLRGSGSQARGRY